MKRIIKISFVLLLSLLLAVPFLPISSAAETGTYIVTADVTQMFSDVSMSGVFLCDVYKGTVVEVTDVRLGYGKVYRKSVSVEGWIDMRDLKPISADYVEDNIVGLEISLPDKQHYIVGEEEFDRTGMRVGVKYKDNVIIETQEYWLYMPSFDTLGAKTITVMYQAFGSGKTYTATLTVEVVAVPIEKLSIEGSPKTVFVEGQSISFEGLAVRVQYSDDRSDRVFAWSEIQNNADFTLTVDGNPPSDAALTLGQHTVCVTYMYPNRSAHYTVNVVEKQPAELQVLQQPYVNYFYSDTRKPNLNGLALTLIYNNGTKETLSYRDCEVIFDTDAAVIGMNAITVRYKNVETQVMLEMIEPTLTGIEIADPGKTVYMMNTLFDGNNTVVNGIYDSGNKAEISGWEVHSFDTQTVGEKKVELRYGDFSVFYTIYVTYSGYLNGDADLDGKISSADARLILRYSVGLETLSGNALFAADRDGNGSIDAGDARSTLRASVGLEPVFVNGENND